MKAYNHWYYVCMNKDLAQQKQFCHQNTRYCQQALSVQFNDTGVMRSV